jgi:hypothetical protein
MVEKVKECVVPRQRTEGQKKVRESARYYLYNCNAIAIGIHYSLPVSSGFHIYTHAFGPSTNAKCRLLHHGYNAVAYDSAQVSSATSQI